MAPGMPGEGRGFGNLIAAIAVILRAPQKRIDD